VITKSSILIQKLQIVLLKLLLCVFRNQKNYVKQSAHALKIGVLWF